MRRSRLSFLEVCEDQELAKVLEVVKDLAQGGPQAGSRAITPMSTVYYTSSKMIMIGERNEDTRRSAPQAPGILCSTK